MAHRATRDRYTGARTLLGSHVLIRSADRETVRRAVGEMIVPHLYEILDPERHVESEIHYAGLRRMGLVEMRYGHECHIDPGRFESRFLLAKALGGRMNTHFGDRTVCVRGSEGVMCSPGIRVNYDISRDCELLTLVLDAEALMRFAVAYLDFPLTRPLVFEPSVPLDRGAAQSLDRLLAFLRQELECPDSLARAGLAVAQLEDLVMTMLVAGHAHNYSARLAGEPRPPSPYYVKRVEDFIHAYAGDALTLEDLVRVSGVSARSLFKGFRNFRGIGPMAYLKQVRLERARDELLAAEPGTATVTEVALRWGFVHLGNFAGDYARRFGETPSETLRRRRH